MEQVGTKKVRRVTGHGNWKKIFRHSEGKSRVWRRIERGEEDGKKKRTP